MDMPALVMVFLLALMAAIVSSTVVWRFLGRPGNWYKACALGLMGGMMGAMGGLILAHLTGTNALAVATACSALMGAVLLYRYVDDI